MRKFLNSYISASLLLMSLATFLWTCGGGGGGGGTTIGFTSEMLTGKAFASINENNEFDDWVIQFDTDTYEFWESKGTNNVIDNLTSGIGNWSIGNGELIVDFPGNATITLQDETAEYIDVQIDDGSNPPENARLYKTNPYVESDVINHTFVYLTFTTTFNDNNTGTLFSPPETNDVFTWMIDENGALNETYDSNGFSYIGYRLFITDPNGVYIEFDENGEFSDVFPERYDDLIL